MFEAAMRPIFTSTAFAEKDYDRITRLLVQFGKQDWSYRPRTYAVLRLIDKVDVLDGFVAEGLKDIAFPYTLERLPSSISNQNARHRFIEMQKRVLTKAMDLEHSKGRHRHFGKSADVHFDMIRLLGRGASGEVHHVRSKLSREEYARKRVLRKHPFRSKDDVQSYENDISNLRRLSHHHLVQFVGSYTDPNYIAILMSPVADYDLRRYLDQDPAPNAHVLRGFFGCLTSAVVYLHQNQCRHKDLKPENVLLKDERVMITDFGSARDTTNGPTTTVGIPSANTPWYAAPEVHDWDDRNNYTDIWSLGCIFLDIATILEKKSRQDLTSFFKENGSMNSLPAQNIPALALILDNPETAGLEPYCWIKQMLREERNSRVSAIELFKQIQAYKSNGVYCGLCCGNADAEDPHETSYEGSDAEMSVYEAQNSSETQKAVFQPQSASEILELQNPRESLDQSNLTPKVSEPTNSPKTFNSLTPPINDLQLQAPQDPLNSGRLLTPPLPESHPQNPHELPGAGDSSSRLVIEQASNIAPDSWAFRSPREEFPVGPARLPKPIPPFVRNGYLHAKGMVLEGPTALLRAAQDETEDILLEVFYECKERRTLEIMKDWSGLSPIHWCAIRNLKSAIPILLGHALNFHHRGSDSVSDLAGMCGIGWKPIHYACYLGHELIVEQLLVFGKDDPDALSDNSSITSLPFLGPAQPATHEFPGAIFPNRWTPLLLAALGGHLKVVKILISRAAAVNGERGDESTRLSPLHCASSMGHRQVVEFLLDSGADIEADGAFIDFDFKTGRALHAAAQTGKISTIRLLLQRGADPFANTADGRTPRMMAARNEAIEELLEAETRHLTGSLKLEAPIAKNADVEVTDAESIGPPSLSHELESRSIPPDPALKAQEGTVSQLAREARVPNKQFIEDLHASQGTGRQGSVTEPMQRLKNLRTWESGASDPYRQHDDKEAKSQRQEELTALSSQPNAKTTSSDVGSLSTNKPDSWDDSHWAEIQRIAQEVGNTDQMRKRPAYQTTTKSEGPPKVRERRKSDLERPRGTYAPLTQFYQSGQLEDQKNLQAQGTGKEKLTLRHPGEKEAGIYQASRQEPKKGSSRAPLRAYKDFPLAETSDDGLPATHAQESPDEGQRNERGEPSISPLSDQQHSERKKDQSVPTVRKLDIVDVGDISLEPQDVNLSTPRVGNVKLEQTNRGRQDLQNDLDSHRPYPQEEHRKWPVRLPVLKDGQLAEVPARAAGQSLPTIDQLQAGFRRSIQHQQQTDKIQRLQGVERSEPFGYFAQRELEEQLRELEAKQNRETETPKQETDQQRVWKAERQKRVRFPVEFDQPEANGPDELRGSVQRMTLEDGRTRKKRLQTPVQQDKAYQDSRAEYQVFKEARKQQEDEQDDEQLDNVPMSSFRRHKSYDGLEQQSITAKQQQHGDKAFREYEDVLSERAAKSRQKEDDDWKAFINKAYDASSEQESPPSASVEGVSSSTPARDRAKILVKRHEAVQQATGRPSSERFRVSYKEEHKQDEAARAARQRRRQDRAWSREQDSTKSQGLSQHTANSGSSLLADQSQPWQPVQLDKHGNQVPNQSSFMTKTKAFLNVVKPW
ncbi:MAG: hypothetical protein M1814_003283 [Vezdaea aestivalis]|nr:MAG: hypothetical protein M1814_003283 [Vezdaea aestivalis]